ncbi:TPA: hypothetical protein ACGIK9_003331 [Acinetobacter baumannii]|uniref:hypothetical protein n=1 Tax=Acinetobacter baumannii TaxID=470 RepID=UPI00338FE475
MKTSEQALIDQIADKGISFSVTVPSPFGHTQIFLDKSLVLEYLSDVNCALAKHHGVSTNDYINWLEQNYSVQCCATTALGKRCKNIVPDGNHVNVTQWVQMQGLVCERHKG